MKTIITMLIMCISIVVNAQLKDTLITQNDFVKTSDMGASATYNLLCNDTYFDIDSITVSIPNGTQGTIVNNNGIITYTPTDTLFAGFDTITYSLSNNVNSVNGTVIIQIGTDEQIATYNILKPYFGIQMTMWCASSNKLTINLNGIVNQVGSGPTTTLGSIWDIELNGYIRFKNPFPVADYIQPISTFDSNNSNCTPTPGYYGYILGGTYEYFQ